MSVVTAVLQWRLCSPALLAQAEVEGVHCKEMMRRATVLGTGHEHLVTVDPDTSEVAAFKITSAAMHERNTSWTITKDLIECLVAITRLDALAKSGPEEAMGATYAERNAAVVCAVAHAMVDGVPAGFGMDPLNDWVVAYIELPTGQVSWHLPPHDQPWDLHDNPTKDDRISLLVKKFYGHEHSETACCLIHHVHVSPHRGCILR